jgi:hypothetical protein
MKKRMLALTTALVMAFAAVGVGTSLVSQASDTTTTQTPKKCKKCKKVIKKAKKCKKSGSTSPQCKKAKKKAKKCKKTLRSRQCKAPKPSPKPSGSGGTSGGQEVKGEIQQPAYFVNSQNGEVSCYSGKHRRGAVLTDGANQGVDGWHFEVDPKTLNQKFTLTADGGEGAPDLDITFYTEFGTPEQMADPTYAPTSQTYETRGPGGETGTVPAGMKLAIVCMLDGANVPFTYKAGGGGGAKPAPSSSPSASAIPAP